MIQARTWIRAIAAAVSCGCLVASAAADCPYCGITTAVSLVHGGASYEAGTETRLGATRETLTSLIVLRRHAMPGGTTGALDPTWGDAGVARIPIWGVQDEVRAIAAQPDGKILVLGTAPDPAENRGDFIARGGYPYSFEPHHHLAVIRLNPDGSLDRSFNAGGRFVFRVGEVTDGQEYTINSEASSLKVRADGRIVIGAVAELAPDGRIEVVTASFFGTLPATEISVALEFVNHRGQFFLTADPDEALFVDRGFAGAWSRTGYAFHVVPRAVATAESVPVCRFYGGPLGHFFSAEAVECAARSASSEWTLESFDAFRVELPSDMGACRSGRVPVHRFLAQRADGARRYTNSPVVADALRRSGWIPEGRGPDHVNLCVP